jgi:transposase
MDTGLEALPEDIEALKAALLAARAEAAAAQAKLSDHQALIAHLKLQIEKLRREIYGPRAERTARLLDQLELQLEDLEATAAEDERVAEKAAARTTTVAGFIRKRPSRQPFPEHLPRERVVEPAPASCACCGGARLMKLGEDVTETLEVIPRQWKVIQHVREKFTCRDCEKISQPPAPFHVTPRGWAGPSLLAMIVFEKFGQHQPLNRQAERYAKEGVPLSLSTLADQVGACAVALRPIFERIEAHVLAGERLHGDDTTVPVWAKNKTTTGRLWVLVRDDRPFAGPAPPAAVFHYSPDRAGVHPRSHLEGWGGVLQADAYAGYNALFETERSPGPVTWAACWAHARRKFFELADIAGGARRKALDKQAAVISPMALEAVQRIDAIFAIERDINGLAADQRLTVRKAYSAPLVADLEAWMRAERAKLSRHNPVAKAMDYMLVRWNAFTRFLDDSRICLTNNAAERALRPVATTESLCTPSSSVCKHWNLVFRLQVTRATFTPHRLSDALALKIAGPDLVRRARDNLLCRKDASLDQLADPVAGDPALLRSISQSKPSSILLGREIGVDTSDPADRADAVRRPGLTLARRQSHAVQSGGDVLIGPASGHGADHSQGVVRGVAVVTAGRRLAEPELGMLPALPVDEKNNLARLFVDIGGDLVHQRSQQLLAGPHRDTGRRQRCPKIIGQAREIRSWRRGDGIGRRRQSGLAVLNAA